MANLAKPFVVKKKTKEKRMTVNFLKFYLFFAKNWNKCKFGYFKKIIYIYKKYKLKLVFFLFNYRRKIFKLDCFVYLNFIVRIGQIVLTEYRECLFFVQIVFDIFPLLKRLVAIHLFRDEAQLFLVEFDHHFAKLAIVTIFAYLYYLRKKIMTILRRKEDFSSL